MTYTVHDAAITVRTSELRREYFPGNVEAAARYEVATHQLQLLADEHAKGGGKVLGWPDVL